jgi:hypothetical protein
VPNIFAFFYREILEGRQSIGAENVNQPNIEKPNFHLIFQQNNLSSNDLQFIPQPNYLIFFFQNQVIRFIYIRFISSYLGCFVKKN